MSKIVNLTKQAVIEQSKLRDEETRRLIALKEQEIEVIKSRENRLIKVREDARDKMAALQKERDAM